MVLFGLSMDYHVFIVSRIKELVDRGTSTEEAVSRGIASTASTVTAAAAVMVAVFAIFASLSTLDIKQMGVGLAVAVLIDATIIRGVLLPATMKLLGRLELVPAALARLAAARARRAGALAGRRGDRVSRVRSLLRPLGQPATYAGLGFLLTPLVLSGVWMGFLVTAWIVIGLFAITPLVVPILMAMGVAVRASAVAEAALARSLLGARIELPPRRQAQAGLLGQGRGRARPTAPSGGRRRTWSSG